MDKYFEIKKNDNFTIVTLLFSELSIEEADEFRTKFHSLAGDMEKKFIIDMAKCSFIPSLALSVFISFDAEMKQKCGKVVFCSLTEQVRAIFKVTKLEEIFKIYPSLDEAKKAIL